MPWRTGMSMWHDVVRLPQASLFGPIEQLAAPPAMAQQAQADAVGTQLVAAAASVHDTAPGRA